MNALNAEKSKVRQLLKRAKSAAAEQQNLNKYDWLTQMGTSTTTFDVQGMKVPPATVPVHPTQTGRSKDDAVYMPLLPR